MRTSALGRAMAAMPATTSVAREHDAFEQRTPRQQHVDFVRDAVQLRGQRLDRGAHQHEIGAAAARRLARRLVRDLPHRHVERVETDHQPVGMIRREVIREARIAGADIDRTLLVRGA